jgi:hypothetical protein
LARVEAAQRINSITTIRHTQEYSSVKVISFIDKQCVVEELTHTLVSAC